MRKLILLGCLSYFVIGLAHVVAGALLEPVMKEYALDYSSAGQWITNQFIGFLIGVLAAPALSSRIGRRSTLVLAMGALTIAEAVYSTLPPWDIILLVAPVAGFGFGMTEAVVGALIMDVFVKGKASAMGWLEVCFGVGALVMPGVASLLIQGGIWPMSFPVLTALAGICLLLWMTLSFGEAEEAVAYVPRRPVLLEGSSGEAPAPGLDGPVMVKQRTDGEDAGEKGAVPAGTAGEDGGLAGERLASSAEPAAGSGRGTAVMADARGESGHPGHGAAAARQGLAEPAGSIAGSSPEPADRPVRPRYARGSMPLLMAGMLFFFLYVGMEMVFANYLPSVMTAQAGLKEAEASAVLSLFWGTMVAGRLFIGAATKAAGYRTYLLASVGASLVSLVLMSGVSESGLSWMLVLVALAGLFMAGIFAVALIYVNEKLPGMTDRTTSLMVACGGLGGALFPKLAGWILDAYDWHVLLQMTAAMAAMLLVLLLALLAMRGGERKSGEASAAAE
ncbi:MULTISPECIES: MFS transporter [unclassified Paenibacillus]|uniref:MFS transporter n=1 Tax=unclassified Paenibacillus TaxID=185978 RepID=UPI0009545822|nr:MULTISPECIES: MFS transporter [unclassified Paenibacillus]ASS67758.1 MFS transporter [Paenibacillus sp. RUD330]SIR61423.1 Major Facilitator Superfamily protein [Paenibacillus sp. RU4X]SIR70046.1 Major Facilitator Superfamily protein [Paenibacillus sp. RU4T]